MAYDGPGHDDPSLPTPVSGNDPSTSPAKADDNRSVAIPSEFGEDEPVAPEPENAATDDSGATEPEAAPAAPEPAPPPAHPTGATPAQAIPGTPPPPHPSTTAKKPTPWGWIIGCTCGGCVVLVLVAVFGMALLGRLVTESDPDAEITPPQSDTQSDVDDAAGTATTSLGPGLSEVEKFASETAEGWAFEVADNSPDWEQVTLHVGPTADDLTTWLQLAWDADMDGYVTVDNGSLETRDSDADTDADGAAPVQGEPGEQLAERAALVSNPGWVAKVVRHSAGWQTAVIWVGPPQSEWVSEIRLRWSEKLGNYEIEGERYIGHDDMEAP